jgi:sulfur-oxidizing protein SoxX
VSLAPRLRPVILGLTLALSWRTMGRAAEALPSPAIVGDEIPSSLTGRPGDPARGRAVILDRQLGNCLLCHALPEPGERFQGNIGPDLAGVAERLTEGQIRLRVVDATRVNPDTAMPAYHRVEGLTRVAAEYRGRPVLTAEQVEDVVAFLRTLRQ